MSYASKGDLAKHITKGHREQVYKCEHHGCDAGFRLKTELRDHYKVHYINDDNESEENDYYEIVQEEFVE